MPQDIIVLCEYFKHSVEERNKELLECQMYNIRNPYINEIVYFTEEEQYPHELMNPKCTWRKITSRPTFRDFFIYINNRITDNQIYLIANLDIEYDETIAKLWWVDWSNKFLCLSRRNPAGTIYKEGWKPTEQEEIQFNNHESHDVWAIGERVRDDLIYNCDYTLGILGCDGKTALQAQWAKYSVHNYAMDIRLMHRHSTGGVHGHRTYKKETRLPKPYGEVPAKPIKDSENLKTNLG